MSLTVPALLAPSAGAKFERGTIERRELGEHDVLIDIAYAGICHSDIHQAREEWGKATFPMVPGHEIAGVVSAVGSGVTKRAVGRPGRRRLLRRLLPRVRALPGRRGAVLRARERRHLQRPPVQRRAHVRRLLHADRRRRELRPAHPRRDRARRRRAAAVRRHHALLAAEELGRRTGPQASRSSAWAGSGTWASSSRTRSAPRSPCSASRCPRRPTAARWAPTTTTRPATRRRSRRCAGRST